jgi:hypothetical protein
LVGWLVGLSLLWLLLLLLLLLLSLLLLLKDNYLNVAMTHPVRNSNFEVNQKR